ncbi:hypothetical protein B9Z55_028515 [Caenorhabditis nigoni]|uniref:Uncharacterized protein n=1 Tax=Caenorhabditis nigoni TaxID=1611254 RepID=A0A2G5SBK1_9PELO|nr:hypothetical protein B9Z55_028515 [Caenorhabditis nigoni]
MPHATVRARWPETRPLTVRIDRKPVGLDDSQWKRTVFPADDFSSKWKLLTPTLSSNSGDTGLKLSDEERLAFGVDLCISCRVYVIHAQWKQSSGHLSRIYRNGMTTTEGDAVTLVENSSSLHTSTLTKRSEETVWFFGVKDLQQFLS